MLFLLLSVIPVNAQFYFFGRNKVQYKDFNWKILKTEHFNIYYYDDFEELAAIGAKFAEEAYADHKTKFNYIVTRRIPLIFYNSHLDFEQTNTIPSFLPEGVGGFFEFLKGRVVIPYLGSISDFRHVIRHELVHVFMMSKVYSVLRDRRIPTGKSPPLWFVEGLAEYWSTDWDERAEMVMRDAVINNIFYPLSTIHQINGSFLMYKEGQSFFEFVASEYGEDKIRLIMENFWRYSYFFNVLEYTLGDNIETIDEKWSYFLKKKYFPLLNKNYPYIIKSEKITNEGFNFSPLYSQSDSSLYFLANRDGYSSIYRIKKDNEDKYPEKAEIILRGEKEAVYESFHLFNATLSLSPQNEIAFVAKSQGSDVIYIFDIRNDKTTESYTYDSLVTIDSPEFSADGKKIIFSASDMRGFVDLYLLERESGKLTRLTSDYYMDKDPVFNKDATEVIFVSDRTTEQYEKKFNIYKINIEDNEIIAVTNENANFQTPHFSPDYKNLYFGCDKEGVFNIWKLEKSRDNKTEGMKPVTNFITSVFDFTFENDSTIITSAFEKFSFQFYRFGIPEYLPDSTFVAFNIENPDTLWKAASLKSETGYEKLSYEKNYTIDYAISQFSTDPYYGARGGAVVAVSDLLSDDKFYFVLYNNAEVQSEILDNFNIAVTRVNTKYRTNFAYGIFHYTGRRFDRRVDDNYFYERNLGGFFALYYPLSAFERIETETSMATSDRSLIKNYLLGRKALLFYNSVSFVHDNSIWNRTGPIDGSRFRLLFGYMADIKYNNVHYYSVIADYRQYLRLGLRSSLAFRGSLYFNKGKEATRYLAGGSWDLRGWPRWSVRGEKLWVSSLELRFPLLDRLLFNFPITDVGFYGFRGAFFFDAGSAWDEKYEQTLGSLGFGIRLNFFNAIVFRYDIGKKIEKNFTQFQPKLFYQFFFGWDF